MVKNFMYFHLEYLDRDALNRDFVRFILEEDDVFTAQHTFAESFMSQDSNHTSRRITAAKILLRTNTALDTRAVSLNCLTFVMVLLDMVS